MEAQRSLHIIAIPFTGVGLHGGYRGDKWFKHRINIFKNYTLRSLANQTNKDFVLWLWFRPEEETNPLVAEIVTALKEVNLPFIITFHGLMYWDDKFSSYGLKAKVRNCIMMLRDQWYNKEWIPLKTLWRYTWENKNKTLVNRLNASLHVLTNSIGKDFEWIYLTRLDSDDMFHRETVALIQSHTPEYRRALVFDKGYIYNIETGQLAEWNPPTNPPFHTIIFPGAIFFDAQSHYEYYGAFRSHEDIPKVFNPITLDMGRYMVSYQGKHISTAWDSPLLKKAYHKIKYGVTEPFKGSEIQLKGYCYTTSGKNISTRWQSRVTKTQNSMIGKEYDDSKTKEAILKDFGL